MKLKDRVLEALKQYFILVTLITILILILGLVFDEQRTFGYEAFASPLLYAAIGVIPVFIFNQEKELSVKSVILRKITELVLLETIYMVIVFSADTIPTEKSGVAIVIALGIVIIYGLVFLIEYIFESVESARMNQYLEIYQNKQKN